MFGPQFYEGSIIGHVNLGGPWALSFFSRAQKSMLKFTGFSKCPESKADSVLSS